MNCDIVRDLLPLYVDEVCSEKSREAVEDHLEGCAACRAYLAELDAPLPGMKELAYDDAVPLREIAAEWKKLRWKSWLKGAAAVAALCLLGVTAWQLLFNWCCIPMTAEDYTLRTYQLSDGSVGVHVDFREGKETRYALTWRDEADGKHFYMARPIIRNNPYEVDFSSGTDSRYPPDVDTAYFGLEEDAVLLFQDGEPAAHPAASEAEEQSWDQPDRTGE